MFLGANGEYSSILELMHYFYFEFNIYIILLFIVLINFIKVFLQYKKFVQHNDNASLQFSGIITSFLCCVAMINALFLQGVVADISNVASDIWFNRVLLVCIICLILFFLQIYFYNKFTGKKN